MTVYDLYDLFTEDTKIEVYSNDMEKNVGCWFNHDIPYVLHNCEVTSFDSPNREHPLNDSFHIVLTVNVDGCNVYDLTEDVKYYGFTFDHDEVENDTSGNWLEVAKKIYIFDEF